VTGEPAEQRAHAGDIGERIRVEAQGRDAEPPEPGRRLGMLRGVVEDDEVRSRREDRLEVGVDAGAEIGNGGHLGGIIAPLGTSDDRRPGTDSEEELGAGGDQRDHTFRRHPDRDRVARVVHHDDGAGRRTGLAAARNGEGEREEQKENSGHEAPHRGGKFTGGPTPGQEPPPAPP
jgi:hypothetical protein